MTFRSTVELRPRAVVACGDEATWARLGVQPRRMVRCLAP